MVWEINWCDDVETVTVITYLGSNVSAGGGCEAAVTGGTRIRECGELLYAKTFPHKAERSSFSIIQLSTAAPDTPLSACCLS